MSERVRTIGQCRRVDLRMSDHNNHNEEQHGKKPGTKREMSRRQFLSYTLGGAGGFMGAGIIIPMVRFAVDPVLQPKAASDWVKVVEESKITNVPQAFTFQIHQVDGWYESDAETGKHGFPKTATVQSLR